MMCTTMPNNAFIKISTKLTSARNQTRAQTRNQQRRCVHKCGCNINNITISPPQLLRSGLLLFIISLIIPTARAFTSTTVNTATISFLSKSSRLAPLLKGAPSLAFSSLPSRLSRRVLFHTTATKSATSLLAMTNNNCNSNETKGMNDAITKRIAIIGGGAAGLATARAFLRVNEQRADGENGTPLPQLEVTIFETRNSLGGIWRHDEENDDETQMEISTRKKSRPMYRNLRTNLPKELMAYREYPWIIEGDDGIPPPSYVTHRQVVDYLDKYAQKFGLENYITFGSRVTQLKVLQNDDDETKTENLESSNDDASSWPRISLEWTKCNNNNDSSKDQIIQQQTFDHVCICNGHYALPSNPQLDGIERFSGKIIHAIEYNDPKDYADQTVLCIGARASGADIAREVGLAGAKCVYLSDSTWMKGMEDFGNVKMVPRTRGVDAEGGVHFSSSGKTDGEAEEFVAKNIDVIIFCSGYDYHFPFINEESNIDLQCVPGERRVKPLYEQLWHAKCPSLSFIGLPHSVVPFPFFEIQATAVVSQLLLAHDAGKDAIPLPSLADRMTEAQRDALAGGPDRTGRVQDTHFLGSHQWDYCRRLAKIGGVYDVAMENFIATNKALYDCSGTERKQMIPGGEDTYRETRFERNDEKQSYKITFSAMAPVGANK